MTFTSGSKSNSDYLKNVLSNVKSNYYAYFSITNEELTTNFMLELKKTMSGNTAVSIADFVACKISVEFSNILCDILKENKYLTNLQIIGTPIGDIGVERICNTLKTNNKISSLYLNETGMTDIGLYHVIQLLKTNKNIKYLDVGRNIFSSKALCDFAKVIAESNVLKTVSINLSSKKDEVFMETLKLSLNHNVSIDNVNCNNKIYILLFYLQKKN